MARIISSYLLLSIIIIKCSKPEKESNALLPDNYESHTIRPDNSETDPDWLGLIFKSAQLEANDSQKQIDLADLPHQRCSFYQGANGKKIFTWVFSQGEDAKQTSNIDIGLFFLRDLPTAPRTWEFKTNTPDRDVTYLETSNGISLWTISRPEDFCILKLNMLRIVSSKIVKDELPGTDIHYREFIARGELNCQLYRDRDESILRFAAEMACNGETVDYKTIQ